MKIRKSIKRILVLFVLGLITTQVVSYFSDRWVENDKRITKMLSKSTQEKLASNILIIDENFFTNRDEFEHMSNNIERYLDSLEPRYKAYGIPKVIDISIVSGGGRVAWYFDFDKRLGKRFREAHVRCTVGFAGSMAFTFMIDYCDERIFSHDTLVMQHQVYISYFGYAYYNDRTRALSMYLSNIEAKSLNLPESIWYEISRLQGDKFFTRNEEKVYGLRTN